VQLACGKHPAFSSDPNTDPNSEDIRNEKCGIPDLVTVSSCTSLDESVSSLASADGLETEALPKQVPPRAIFNMYWEKRQDEELRTSSPLFQNSSIYITRSGTLEHGDKHTCSETMRSAPKNFADLATFAWEKEEQKRRIFGNTRNSAWHFSAPTIQETPKVSCFRKTSSSPTLLKTPGPSCLRTGRMHLIQKRYTNKVEGDVRSRSLQCRSSGSVSFNPQVLVYEFEKLDEYQRKASWFRLFC